MRFVTQVRRDLVAIIFTAPLAVGAGLLVAAGYGRYVLLLAATVIAAPLLVMIARSITVPRTMSRVDGATAGAIAVGAFAVLPLNGMRVTSATTYGDALILLTIIFLLIGLLGPARDAFRRPPAWLALGVGLLLGSYFLYGLFPVVVEPQSPIFSEHNPLTGAIISQSETRQFVQVVFALVVAPYALGCALNTWQRVRLASFAWAAGTALSALIAVLAAFSPWDLQAKLTGADYSIPAYGEISGRYAGLTVHSDTLGLTCAMALPLALIYLGSARPRRAMASAIVGGLYLVAILVSGSRAALLAALAALVYTALRVPSTRARLAGMSLIAVGVSFTQAALIEHLSLLQRLLGTVPSADISDAAHSSRLADAFNLWVARPITGYGFQVVRGAHNIFLQFLTAGGIVACAGFVAIAGGTAILGSRLSRIAPPEMRPLASALLASMAAWMTASLIAASVFDRFLYMPLALLLAMLFAMRADRALGDVDPQPVLVRAADP